MSWLRRACEMVGAALRPGALVVLRSTVPIGTTRGFVEPLLETLSGLTAGADFHLAFAPERTIEGKALQELSTLPQVIGGLDEDSVEATVALFRELTPTIVRVSSLEAAEMVKLVNNCFRDVVFAFSNQMAQVARAYGADIVEVIKAANQGYPRDPVPLPSPGVGGPCLTKDPFILAAAGVSAGIARPLPLIGREINQAMHGVVADALLDELARLRRDPREADVLICGLAFKGRPETTDLRGSPALAVAALLRGRVGRLYGHDPVVGAEAIRAAGLEPVELPAGAAGKDAILLLNNHPFYEGLDGFALARSLRRPGTVFDGWHVLRPEDVVGACPCTYLGLSFRRSSADGKGESA
jgi:nucleotide sugar dehydrogenase